VHVAPAKIASRDMWLLVSADLRHVARVAAVRDFLVDEVARSRDLFTVPASPARRGRRWR
jgi:hypothetical protein